VPAWPEAGQDCLLKTTCPGTWPGAARGRAPAGQSGASPINHSTCPDTSSDSQPIYPNWDERAPKQPWRWTFPAAVCTSPHRTELILHRAGLKVDIAPHSPALSWEIHPGTSSAGGRMPWFEVSLLHHG